MDMCKDLRTRVASECAGGLTALLRERAAAQRSATPFGAYGGGLRCDGASAVEIVGLGALNRNDRYP